MTVSTVAVTGDTMLRPSLRARGLATVAGLALLSGAQGAWAQATLAQGPPVPATPVEGAGPIRSAPTEAETTTDAGGRPQAEMDQNGVPVGELPASGPDEITVTGTRIVRDGYSAPTPVSVISTEEINREAPANISDFVNTLPAVRGSTTAASSNGALSNGQAGIATVNLRNLGANRTLVLIDGQRSVPSATNGNVDVNTISQSLIERVEVVTGGASSAYGSDAVSGVVNFILDKDYQGVKAEYEYGVTTYGDGGNHKASLTAGTAFGGDRGHIIASGEYFTQKIIRTIDRDWNENGFFQIDNPAYSAAACTDNNPATACVNARLIQAGIGTGVSAPGALILNSAANPVALRGTVFSTINPATGRATTGRAVFGPQSGQWMVGGDYRLLSSGHVSSASLLPSEERKGVFTRASWEFAPWLSVFGQFSYSYFKGESVYQKTFQQPVTIQRDNAFLPEDVRAAMATANVNTIAVGIGNDGIPAQGNDNKREVYRYVAGADGEFAALDREWRWDTYYQKGVTKTDELLTNSWYIPRLNAATDAVVAAAGNVGNYASGSIVCRINIDANTANDDRSCVPINRLGVGGVTPDALAYVLYNGRQPQRFQKLQQDVAALNFSTNNLFEIWAGPVSLAFGAEYRKEQVSGSVDPLFQPQFVNGVTVSNWRYGNFPPQFGSFNVKEAFIETVIPIIRGMDFNGALRVTDYSTSGQVETWKVGLTWQVIDGVRVRGTISRDIRAPNLGELFSPGAGATNSVQVPNAAGVLTADSYINSNVGNPDLQPEIARTYGAGAVVTPGFLPGLAASVDYYKIDLGGAISTLSAQTLADQCYLQNISSSCEFISTSGGRGVTTRGLDVLSIEVKPFNFVSIKTEGIDFETSYRRRVGPGNLALRVLANYAINRVTNNGVDVATDTAGENSGSLPDWTYRLSAAYSLDEGFSFQAVGRGVSPGVYDNSFIVCTTDCPVSTVANRTVNRNHIKGAWYLDMNADYKFEIAKVKTTAFISIRNVLNSDPVLVANGPTGDNTPAYPQTNRALYDVLGRVFRIGLRASY